MICTLPALALNHACRQRISDELSLHSMIIDSFSSYEKCEKALSLDMPGSMQHTAA
jgi:hypothetical protein